MPETKNEVSFEELAKEVDRKLEEIKELDEESRKKALELKTALESFHKEALIALVKKFKADPRGKELLVESLDEPSVYALLSMHGIIKPPIEAKVLEVLEQVRDQIASHGGAIELVKVEDYVAFVRLHGACAGCSMSAQTLREGVEEAIKARVPEIERVEQVQDIPVSGFLQIENASTSAEDHKDAGWIEGPSLEDVEKQPVYHFKEANALISNTDGKLFAFYNSCPHMGQPLHEGTVSEGTLTCPFHSFKFLLESGECLTVPQVQLQPFPLKVVDGKVWVRPS